MPDWKPWPRVNRQASKPPNGCTCDLLLSCSVITCILIKSSLRGYTELHMTPHHPHPSTASSTSHNSQPTHAFIHPIDDITCIIIAQLRTGSMLISRNLHWAKSQRCQIGRPLYIVQCYVALIKGPTCLPGCLLHHLQWGIIVQLTCVSRSTII